MKHRYQPLATGCHVKIPKPWGDMNPTRLLVAQQQPRLERRFDATKVGGLLKN